jgi:hypothetical protein
MFGRARVYGRLVERDMLEKGVSDETYRLRFVLSAVAGNGARQLIEIVFGVA